MVNALTVDVEDYFHVHAFAGVIDPKNWDRYSCRVEQNTQRVLDLFASAGARATFFVLGWVAEKYPQLVCQIRQGGHQVGCHGFAHKVIYAASPEEFRADIRAGKQAVEDALGSSVKSYRAPSYSVTSKTLWALEILVEEGFEFDSSIFPVVHDNYGIPDAPRFPYVRSVNGRAHINEFPPTTLRQWGFNVPVAGGGYLRLFPYAATAWALRRINSVERQPAMVYLHPWEFDPKQPRINAPWRSRFRHYQNLDTTEDKCKKLLRDFSWAPMENVFASALGGANESRR